MQIRPARETDLPFLLAIHNDAVDTLTAAWTTKRDTMADRAAWLAARDAQRLPVIVAEREDGRVVGYGTFGPFRPREGYRLTAEHSVYVEASAQRQGIGRRLVDALIERAGTDGYHVLVGALDADNAASIALHQACGFEIAGRLPQVGHKFGRWLDLVFVSRVLDDRADPPTA